VDLLLLEDHPVYLTLVLGKVILYAFLDQRIFNFNLGRRNGHVIVEELECVVDKRLH
jgi:hypothetical protein